MFSSNKAHRERDVLVSQTAGQHKVVLHRQQQFQGQYRKQFAEEEEDDQDGGSPPPPPPPPHYYEQGDDQYEQQFQDHGQYEVQQPDYSQGQYSPQQQQYGSQPHLQQPPTPEQQQYAKDLQRRQRYGFNIREIDVLEHGFIEFQAHARKNFVWYKLLVLHSAVARLQSAWRMKTMSWELDRRRLSACIVTRAFKRYMAVKHKEEILLEKERRWLNRQQKLQLEQLEKFNRTCMFKMKLIDMDLISDECTETYPEGIAGSFYALQSSIVQKSSAVVTVVAGSAHTLALTTRGAVYSLGSGLNGELGYRSDFEASAKVIPFFPQHRIRVVGLCSGERHSVATSSIGAIFTWGSNRFGALGLGQSTKMAAEPHHVPLPQQPACVQCCCGSTFTVLLVTGGKVVIFVKADVFQSVSRQRCTPPRTKGKRQASARTKRLNLGTFCRPRAGVAVRGGHRFGN